MAGNEVKAGVNGAVRAEEKKVPLLFNVVRREMVTRHSFKFYITSSGCGQHGDSAQVRSQDVLRGNSDRTSSKCKKKTNNN